jgi:alkylresorcinol/alkylpyrone synthase
MPTIASVATAVPPHKVTQQLVRNYTGEVFSSSINDVDRYLTVFDHSEIDTRYLAAPVEWFMQREGHTFSDANDRFIDVACTLGEDVARRCLEQARVSPQEIDHIIFVSTTGLAAPSIDARLMTLLGMGRHTRRTPIWGLGCAGGLGGLERAQEYVRAYPAHRCLLVTVELCTLTMQFNDLSKRNLVALSLFGDGAAAVLVEGDQVERKVDGPRIVDTRSTLFPDSLDLMGWDIVDEGFRVIFGTRIPSVVTGNYKELASEFLALHQLTPDDIKHHIYHPGGAKVLKAYESALNLDGDALTHSRSVLRDYGNMSSATVFFVLERFLQQRTIAPGDKALMCVFGPGFSAELALIEG